jgi:hypothetical protein
MVDIERTFEIAMDALCPPADSGVTKLSGGEKACCAFVVAAA